FYSFDKTVWKPILMMDFLENVSDIIKNEKNYFEQLKLVLAFQIELISGTIEYEERLSDFDLEKKIFTTFRFLSEGLLLCLKSKYYVNHFQIAQWINTLENCDKTLINLDISKMAITVLIEILGESIPKPLKRHIDDIKMNIIG
ncbi:MAG: hypothetical protein MHPSP_004218, partial [Paramarteilia canceri]